VRLRWEVKADSKLIFFHRENIRIKRVIQYLGERAKNLKSPVIKKESNEETSTHVVSALLV